MDANLFKQRMGYGAMWLTGPGVMGFPKDRKAAVDLLHEARDLGVTFVDTAYAYGPETNESIVAEGLNPYEGLTIATKCGTDRSSGGSWFQDGRPERIREQVEGSLQRLNVEIIDLLQLHAPDRKVPIEESVGAMADLQRDGKVRAIGLSNVSVNELRSAQAVAPIVSVQNHYNIEIREHEDVLQECESQSIAFIAYCPIARGDLQRHKALKSVADRHGVSTIQIGLAWLLAHSPAAVVIPGTANSDHLRDNVAAAEISLTEEDLGELGR